MSALGSAPRRMRRKMTVGSPEMLALYDGTCFVRSKEDPRRLHVDTPPSVKKKSQADEGNEAEFTTFKKLEEEVDYLEFIEGTAQKGDRRYLEYQYPQE